MPNNRKETHRQLDALFAAGSTRSITRRGRKFAIISDVHLGNGGGADDFAQNEKVLIKALDHYRRKDFTLILLGDIEEFWQFELREISARYDRTIYSRMRKFGDDRIIRLYGNHDTEWGSFDDPATETEVRSEVAAEAIILKGPTGGKDFFLVHGHQGSIESDKNSWISRAGVRAYRMIEPLAKRLGFGDHGSATKSQIRKDYERIMYSWATKNKTVIVCGHTHRAIFASRSYIDRLNDRVDELEAQNVAGNLSHEEIKRNRMTIRITNEHIEKEKDKDRDISMVDREGPAMPNYFNTGCALYSDGLTLIELDDEQIQLVKWETKDGETPRRRVFEGAQTSTIIRDSAGRTMEGTA